MTEIIADKLYLGSYDDATNKEFLRDNQITMIVCVARELIVSADEPIQVHNFLIDETQQDLRPYLWMTTNIVMMHPKQKVLLHCLAGISRSPIFVMACLLVGHYCATVEDALNYIRCIRPEIDPNPEFVEQLGAWWTVRKQLFRASRETATVLVSEWSRCAFPDGDHVL